jgi:hypothetical protein
MVKTLYQVWVLEDGEWVKVNHIYPTEKAALKALEECLYAPDEYKIIKIKKEI